MVIDSEWENEIQEFDAENYLDLYHSGKLNKKKIHQNYLLEELEEKEDGKFTSIDQPGSRKDQLQF